MKVGASQIAAAEVAQQRRLEARQARPRAARVRRRRRRRGTRHPRARAALDEFFKKHDLPRKGVRLGIGTNRVGVRVLDVDGIDDDEAARQRRHLPCARSALDPDGSGRDGLPRRRHHDVRGGRRHASRRSLPPRTASRSITSLRRSTLRTSSSTAIDVEAFALLRAVAPTARRSDDGERTAVVALALGHDRTTLAISDGERLRLHPRARVGRRASRRGDRAASSASRTEEADEVKLGVRSLTPTTVTCRRKGRAGTRSRQERVDQPGSRARRFAAVLPGAARLARARRDPRHRRNDAHARPRRGARASGSCSHPGRRPAGRRRRVARGL